MASEKPQDATPQVHEKRLSSDRVAKKEKKSKKKDKALENLVELRFKPADSKEAVAPHESHDLEGTANSGESRKKPGKRESKASKPIEEGAMDLDSGDDSDATRLRKKVERKARKESERMMKEVRRRLMEQELGPSPTESGRHVEAEQERKAKRKAEKHAERAARKAAEEAEAQAAVNSAMNNAAPPPAAGDELFAIDTKRTPVDLEALAAAREKADRVAAQKAKLEAPELNRAARRRLKLIARQRERILKDMGLTADSTERMDEVDAKLAEWTVTMDQKTEIRLEKKKERKAKEATRLRNRRGRLLKGRKLKVREKELREAAKQDARKARRAISAQS